MARGDEEGGRVSFLLSGKALRTFRAAILALQVRVWRRPSPSRRSLHSQRKLVI